jgi:hypothetical protein
MENKMLTVKKGLRCAVTSFEKGVTFHNLEEKEWTSAMIVASK